MTDPKLDPIFKEIEKKYKISHGKALQICGVILIVSFCVCLLYFQFADIAPDNNASPSDLQKVRFGLGAFSGLILGGIGILAFVLTIWVRASQAAKEYQAKATEDAIRRLKKK